MKLIKVKSIRFKILSIILAVLVVFTITVFLIINHSNKDMDALLNVRKVMSFHLFKFLEIESDIMHIRQCLTNMSAKKETKNSFDYNDRVKKYFDNANKLIDELINDKNIHNENKQIIKKLKLEMIDFYQMEKKLASIFIKFDTIESNKLMVEFDVFANKLSNTLFFLIKKYSNKVDDEILFIVNSTKKRLLVFVIITIIIFIISLIVAFIYSKKIINPLILLKEKFIYLAKGDLEQNLDVRRTDELGDLITSFNAFLQNIRSFILRVKNSIKMLNDNTIQISASSNELATAIEELSNQTQSVSSNVLDLTSRSEENALSIEEQRTYSKNASDLTLEGSKTIEKSIESFTLVKQETVKMSSVINNLGNSVNEIGKIIDLINEIADQTNLLALNAAIEAARAGDAGRGFAVVADEVRKLAERTGKATKEIENIINSLQNESELAKQAMRKSIDIVNTGEELGKSSMSILSEIVESSKMIFIASDVISESIVEESKSLSEINNTISQISVAVEESSNTVSEVNDSILRLSEMSADLQKLVEYFKVKEDNN